MKYSKKMETNNSISQTTEPVLKRFKRVTLQMICDSCFEILHQQNNNVECDKLGIPVQIRLEQIFKQPQFKKPNQCLLCKSKSKHIKYYIGYSPDNIKKCDLPF